MWNIIADRISQATQKPFAIDRQRSVGGGDVNQAYEIVDQSHQQIYGGEKTYFLKLNDASRVNMFEAEALGLREMAETQTIQAPRPICWGTADGSAYIVMEWLEIGRGSRQSWAKMGQQLAEMHRVTNPKGFGWNQNNTIGFIPQINDWTDSWSTFWRDYRIGYQLKLARKRGGNFPCQDEFLQAIPELLMDHDPQPSLVHGDLWSGNAAVTQAGNPIIFDPATYYGDREVDLAMSELFGRFPNEFYAAYDAAYPINSGYERRKTFYNLYHILNHFNQFGGGYGAQANSMMERLLG
ncbi:MAG: fructosamine kinase family protein [Cyanobacteria bacterium P01_F01_bin.150]